MVKIFYLKFGIFCCQIFFFTGNGFIEGEELNAFLREFIASVNPEENFQVFLLENFLMS